MTKGCGGEWRLGRSSNCNSVILSHKTSPNAGRGEQTKGYKTFGGKLASSKVEDKENGEFHHEVILTVQSHSVPALALRCSPTPQNTHKAGERSGLQTSTQHMKVSIKRLHVSGVNNLKYL
ncbi:hypothetical protein ILYODFUR_017918 [Ilyodon furcidens]|uniref:Uncharacterized protein n=1 Tax=Ilyodon furcidens TaxID=33524 RepID=A0ABV0TAR3_9TELE